MDKNSNIVPYTQGLHEVADNVFAFLQPDGGWGWSNAGLIASEWSSLLVDTLFDLKLTQKMLDSMATVTSAHPINVVVNTHANGDHCYGNSLVAGDNGAQIITTDAAAVEMEAIPPSALAALMHIDINEETNAYIKDAFGSFDFTGIELPAPDRTFSGELQLDVGGRTVELIEVGPAHTSGDLLVHLPDASTIFCGDILFINGTPIIWDGPVANWIDACDRILGLEAEVIIPGHGPLTDSSGVTAVRDYLTFVDKECRERHAGGQTADEVISEIDLGVFKEWGEWERIAVNVHAIFRELGDDNSVKTPIELFNEMAKLKK
ncbi:MAG: MBL fold metallo-hydrolase [Actinomycetota bacterium]|nr:MBL fold metallo-hydrolase [Actinomycetota bacterium]